MTRSNPGWRGPSASSNRPECTSAFTASSVIAFPPCERISLWKQDHRLAVEATQPRNCSEAIAGLDVEGDDLVLSHTIESAMRSKAQTWGLLEPHTIIWDEHPRETPVDVVIFADHRHCICCTERMLAANDDIAAWRNRKVT